jgi:hypothetical protein
MASVTLSADPRGPVGTAITVYPRTTTIDPFTGPAGSSVASGTVAADRTVELTGLTEGANYLAAGKPGSTWYWTAISLKGSDRPFLTHKDLPFINVRDSLPPYADVVCDDTTDTSAALQTRHDLAEATSRAVYYPGDEHSYIAANLQLGDNAYVFGDGRATTIKLKPSAAVAAGDDLAYAAHRYVFVNKHGGTTGNTGIHVSSLTIDGNVSGSNDEDEFYFGIALWGVRDATITNVKVQNVRGDGILIGRHPTDGQDSEDVHVRDIILENVGVDAGVGAHRQGIAVIQCRRFTIRNVTADTVGGYVVDVEPDDAAQVCEDFTIDGIHGYNVEACVGLGQSGGTIRRGKIGTTTLRDGVDHSPVYVVSLQNCDSITVDRPETDAATVTNLVWCDGTESNVRILGYSELVLLSRSASQTNVANTTPTPIEWTVRRVDRDDMNDATDATSRKRIVAKATGIYQVAVNLRWSSTAGTYRQVKLRKNGTTDVANDYRPASLAISSCAFPAIALAQGDYIEVMVQHDAGSAIDVMLDADYSPECSMVKVA